MFPIDHQAEVLSGNSKYKDILLLKSEVGDSISFRDNRLWCHRQLPGTAETQAGRSMGAMAERV